MAAPTSSFAPAPIVTPAAPMNGYFTNGYADAMHTDRANGSATMTPNEMIQTPGSLAGRKRSRGDIHAFDEEDEELGDGSVTTPIDSAADSHAGTWAEESITRKPFELAHMKRPSISSRKSQRKHVASGSDDLAQLVLPEGMREAAAEPLIDEATRVLGISWTRMDSSEALLINKAAYSKWIQNHYPRLKDVEVWFENSALPGYLVEARDAYSGQQLYYIFSHDLTEARLVTTEAAQLVPRLRLLPALHLAAPGGHIRAETDPITAAQNELDVVQVSAADGISRFSREVSQLRDDLGASAAEPNGMCSAHQMELD